MRIGVFDVEILEGPEVDLELARAGVIADSDPEYLTIRLRADVAPAVRREALLHEILHHCWHQTALPELVGDHEEVVVRSLSALLSTCVEVRPSR